MRWPVSTYNPYDWNSWYAWHPVRIDDEWVWLEHVGRKMIQLWDTYRWEYANIHNV